MKYFSITALDNNSAQQFDGDKQQSHTNVRPRRFPKNDSSARALMYCDASPLQYEVPTYGHVYGVVCCSFFGKPTKTHCDARSGGTSVQWRTTGRALEIGARREPHNVSASNRLSATNRLCPEGMVAPRADTTHRKRNNGTNDGERMRCLISSWSAHETGQRPP